MADPWGINTAEIEAMVKEFRRIRGRLKPAMRRAAAKSAAKVKADARQRIIAQSTRTYLKQYPNSIGYTIWKSDGTLVAAEVGPDKGRPQGPLGNILEYGTSRLPPLPHLQPALVAEGDGFEDNMGDAAEEAIFE